MYPACLRDPLTAGPDGTRLWKVGGETPSQFIELCAPTIPRVGSFLDTFFRHHVLFTLTLPVPSRLTFGRVEYFSRIAQTCPRESRYQLLEGLFKKVRPARPSYFDARSVHRIREHGKIARTPLAAFFNSPKIYDAAHQTRKQYALKRLRPRSTNPSYCDCSWFS